MTGSRSAIVSCSIAVTPRAAAERTRLRIRRSPAMKSTRSPARAASAASSSAASIAESSRGTSSTRPAEVREVSSTRTTRRSRSGCQVRTTTERLRALARQSMERTSSPVTYSRSESNSVPCPRTRTAARPSRSRSRARRLGRCLRDSKGGSERMVPGTSRVCWRAARPSGPTVRTVTPTAWRSPRRRGCTGVVSATVAPASSRTWCRLLPAPVDGCQASRTSARSRRVEAFVATSTVSAGCPVRTGGVANRWSSSRPVRAARAQSSRTQPTTTSTHSHIVPSPGRSTTGSHPSRSSRGTRPVMAISGVPAPSRVRWRARAPRRRPPARPPVAGPGGARAWRARAP